jgi:hypothetical protein
VQQEIYMELLEKQPLERPKDRWNNNSTLYITKTGYERQIWLKVAPNIHWWI